MANALLNAVKVALQAAMAQRKSIDLVQHLATDFWLLAFGFWLLAFGFWLLLFIKPCASFSESRVGKKQH